MADDLSPSLYVLNNLLSKPAQLYTYCQSRNIIEALLTQRYAFNDNDPHILISGRTPFIARKITHFYLEIRKSIHTEIIPHHFSEKNAMIAFLKEKVQQKSVTGSRHLIVIHALESVPPKTLRALLYLMDAFITNAQFICTSLHIIYPFQNELLSRCMYINANIKTEPLARDLVKNLFPCNKHKQSDAFIKTLLWRGHHDIVNMAFILDVERPEDFIGHFPRFIEEFFHRIFHTEDPVIIAQQVKDICARISVTSIPISILSRIFIHYCMIKSPLKVHECIAICAFMDHEMLFHQHKDIFVLEKCMFTLCHLLLTHSKPCVCLLP